nr:MAG TPA_asm: hypothetical protein [Caudoviricetes sp.]
MARKSNQNESLLTPQRASNFLLMSLLQEAA